jgi:hypothetical protein
MAAGEHSWRPALAGALCAGIYAVMYLYAIDDLSLADRSSWSMVFGTVPLWQAMEARAAFHFEAIGLLQAGPVTWLVSPFNLTIGLLLGGLLGANVHGVLALRERSPVCTPSAGGRAGVLGGAIPALLAGGACCAPTLLLLGVPGLAAFAGFMPWLLPLSAFLLASTRLWLLRQGAPRLVRRRKRTAPA